MKIIRNFQFHVACMCFTACWNISTRSIRFNWASEFFLKAKYVFYKEKQSVIFAAFDRILTAFRLQFSKTNIISISLFLDVYVMKCPSYELPRDCGIDWFKLIWTRLPHLLASSLVFCRKRGVSLVKFPLGFHSCVPGQYSQHVLQSCC